MSRKYIPQLDGFRAIAILLVLFAHSMPVFVGLGFFQKFEQVGGTGVQAFFVLSGYLITGILLRSKDRPSYFLNFFARRGLRIWPLYYAVLVMFAFSGQVHSRGTSFWVYTLYLSNLVYGHRSQPGPLGQMWSLAVEEQFYLFWPFIVWKLSKRRLEHLAIGLVVFVPILRAVLPLDRFNTLFQLDALALGALLACRQSQLAGLWRWAVGLTALLPLGMYLQLTGASPLAKTFQVYGAGALLVVVLQDHSWPARILRNPALVYLGRISYGVYLLHNTVFAIILKKTTISSVTSVPKAIAAVCGECAAVIAVASISFYAFERPILNLKRHFEQKPTRAAHQILVQPRVSVSTAIASPRTG